MKQQLLHIYQVLLDTLGPQRWWPAKTRFEVMVGAILTQNTNWSNVKRAIENLKAAKALNAKVIHAMPHAKLAKLIRPAGYFNIKAKRLKNYIDFFMTQYQGNIKKMMTVPLSQMRPQLLAVNGVGPETADSILLYALDQPIFVIDAYTKRICTRHQWGRKGADYHQLQKFFMKYLESDAGFFNEYHALFVRIGAEFCKPTPRCEACPLGKFLKRPIRPSGKR